MSTSFEAIMDALLTLSTMDSVQSSDQTRAASLHDKAGADLGFLVRASGGRGGERNLYFPVGEGAKRKIFVSFYTSPRKFQQIPKSQCPWSVNCDLTHKPMS